MITEGPWKYDSGGMTVMSGDGQMSIADIRGFGYLSSRLGTHKAVAIMDANGRAITALPELLAAAIDTVSKIEDCVDGKINFRADFAERLKDAIKKAIGEE